MKYIFILVKIIFYFDLKYMLLSVENDLLLLVDFFLFILFFLIIFFDSLNWYLIYLLYKLLLYL